MTVRVRGRPRRGPGDKFRSIAWFEQVAIQSGKTAYGLEQEFSPSQCVLREDGTRQRPAQWDKYSRGEAAPSTQRATEVEAVYPGTEKWLGLGLWQLMNSGAETSSDTLLLLIGQESSDLVQNIQFRLGTRRERPHQYTSSAIHSIWKRGGLNSLTGLMAAYFYQKNIPRDDATRYYFMVLEAEVQEAIFYLLIYQLSHPPLYKMRYELYAWFVKSVGMPVHGNFSAFDLDYASHSVKKVIDFALDNNIIKDSHSAINRYYFGLWMMGRLSWKGYELPLNDGELYAQLDSAKEIIARSLKIKDTPFLINRLFNNFFLPIPED